MTGGPPRRTVIRPQPYAHRLPRYHEIDEASVAAAMAMMRPDIGEDGREVATVARGGAANLLGAVASAVTNFLVTFAVARFVSQTDAGAFFAITSLFLMLETLGRLGSDTGAVYFVARWRALGQLERVRIGLRVAITPVLGTCLVALVAVIAFAPQLAHLLGAHGSGSVLLLRVLAVLLPFATLNDVTLGATRGFGWMTPTVMVEKVGRPVIQFVLVLVVLAAGWTGALGFAWALPYIGAFLASAALLRRVVRDRLQPAAERPRFDVEDDLAERHAVSREYWKFTLPRAVAGVAQIVLQRLDIVLVAIISGPRDAAIYTAATRFLVVGQFANQAISAPIQPRLSAALSSGDLDRARQLYRVSTTWLVLISWPLFGLAASLAPLYVDLFGHGYRSGASTVVLLSGAMLVASAVGLVDSVVIMAGRTSWNLGTTLLALVLNVGFDVALIPHFGVIGAAVGWVVSILAANLVPLALAWRGIGLHPFGLSTALACLVCGSCFIVLPGGVYDITGARLPTLIAALAGAAAYAYALRRWKVEFDIDGLRRGRSKRDRAGRVTAAAGP